MKYKLDKQINEVAVGVHNKGRTSKSGFVGVVIRPLSYLCGHVPLINNDKYECVYTAKDKTAVHQIPTRQTRRPRVEPITRRYMCMYICANFSLFLSPFLCFFFAKSISVVRLFDTQCNLLTKATMQNLINSLPCNRKNSLVKFLVSFVTRNKYRWNRGSDNFVVSTIQKPQKLGLDIINVDLFAAYRKRKTKPKFLWKY